MSIASAHLPSILLLRSPRAAGNTMLLKTGREVLMAGEEF